MQMIQVITEAYTDLDPLFHPDDNIPFSSSTINLGPQVVTIPHRDHHNPAYGVCAITSLGRYNPDLGGHLVLPELNLTIRFPPGANIVIPSATLIHYNLPVQRGEERFSIVQYSAAGLFRWWGHGFQTAASYRQALNLQAPELREAAAARLEAGIRRFTVLPASQLNEMHADVDSGPNNSPHRPIIPIPLATRSTATDVHQPFNNLRRRNAGAGDELRK